MTGDDREAAPFSLRCRAGDLLAAVARLHAEQGRAIRSEDESHLLDSVLRALGPEFALIISEGRAEAIPWEGPNSD